MTIKQKQCLLAYLGYYTGLVDGIWGAQTQQATEAFQRDHRLTVDGVFGDSTQARIIEAITSGEAPVVPDPPANPESGSVGTYWDDAPNFNPQEFACPCSRCGGFPVEPAERLVRSAQALRNRVGKPMHISSGVRCPAHNTEVGGVANSRHLLGHAMDFRVDGMTSAQVLPLAQATPGIVYAYAIDDSYVHMDIGG